jgi:aconitate hydratase
MESGKVVIASITSCTNTSNPYVMIGAGLVARKARALGLNRKPWVKTSLAPGSKVVSAYLEAAACRKTSTRSASTSSAMAAPPASATPVRWKSRSRTRFRRAIWSRPPCCRATATSKAASPDVRANYLASPPLVVAYAMAGTMDIKDVPP